MPLRLGPSVNDSRAQWTCAFVNNMPDGSFDATERQFLELLDFASKGDVIEVTRHTMEGVPRGAETSERIAREYRALSEIARSAPDLLVVTGSNPIEVNIEDEPYWEDLAQLLSWGKDNVHSKLLSCLSAHAALRVFDGCTRVRLPVKCTGVFDQWVDVEDPLGQGIEPEIELPHSRTNTVPDAALDVAGYHIVVRSPDVGWSVARKTVSDCQVVLIQGHPEYEPSSLLREYRRDAGRFVRHERDEPPILPFHCVSPDDWPELERVQKLITSTAREPKALEAFPFEEAGERAPWTWHSMAQRLYANWLSSVK